ncbi:MAG: sigma-70 family RNA polymerase sigma factor [Bacteroidota bacterium]|nr:sigma-70 family RNA polymerase sigma factor [Bacteroidota bacterium]
MNLSSSNCIVYNNPKKNIKKIKPARENDGLKHTQGSWEMDLIGNTLYWSDNQFKLYGFEPGELNLKADYFLEKTTSPSDLKRVKEIIDRALKSEQSYQFKRRIIKKNGEIGFVETKAVIIRSNGIPVKIIGITTDISNDCEKGITDYNDPNFYNSLYSNYRKAIYSDILKMVQDKDVANDLCQEVFIKVWNNMAKYNPAKGELYTWLINISRNHCRDYFRSTYFQSNKLTSAIDGKTPSTPKLEAFNLDRMDLYRLLSELSTEQKEIIELLFLKGFTQNEVASIKNLPLGTVKTKSRSALLNLRRLVAA